MDNKCMYDTNISFHRNVDRITEYILENSTRFIPEYRPLRMYKLSQVVVKFTSSSDDSSSKECTGFDKTYEKHIESVEQDSSHILNLSDNTSSIVIKVDNKESRILKFVYKIVIEYSGDLKDVSELINKYMNCGQCA